MLETKKVSVKFHKCEGTTHSPMIRWIAGQNAIFNIGGRSAPIQINGIDHSMLLQEISHLPKTQTVLKKAALKKLKTNIVAIEMLRTLVILAPCQNQ